MPDRIPRLYWDACVFLAYVEGERERLTHIEAVLDEARQGKVEIVTSTASITEVAFGSAEMDERALNPEIQAAIEGLWVPNSPIMLSEVSVLVVEKARDLMRRAVSEGAKVPKPMDAIHLSTALRLEVDEFQTYDGPLQKAAGNIGLASGVPSTSSPSLPIEYGDEAPDGNSPNL